MKRSGVFNFVSHENLLVRHTSGPSSPPDSKLHQLSGPPAMPLAVVVPPVAAAVEEAAAAWVSVWAAGP
jgi:hypothetical protein